ncbi:hypothetical protein IV203_019030 [Nitzschia inconspicua]|uniref:Uncharacterized protein n=1 Tax=Nitzschia inconspicua TaxID=303405 RepID=A0A9K3LXT5_9STRA|nr:hypothetical protein IV203_022646 [Nitzschia inconspicua]KAG7370460.1 hypothetical protein IV203_019030 [Nitzschia inconspicua]
MPSLVQESYPPHLLAQKLNNRGAYQAEQGYYESAISTYVKALKLSESSANHAPCGCRYCSLNTCMSTSASSSTSSLSPILMRRSCPQGHKSTPRPSSRKASQQQQEQEEDGYYHDDNDVIMMEDEEEVMPFAPVSPSFSVSSSYGTSFTQDPTEEPFNCGGYVYRHALRVHPHTIHYCHNMGVTLSLVIIFNLALAHHLMGIRRNNIKNTGSSSWNNSVPNMDVNYDSKALKKALQLYELAYQLHVDEQQMAATTNCATHHQQREDREEAQEQEGFESKRMGMLRFTMIVSNNLGEIHRVAKNTTKHVMCLQHLLSTIMYMVDGHFLMDNNNNNNNNNNDNQDNRIRSGITSRSNSSSGTTRTSISTFPITTTPTVSTEELDGFLRNASPLMLYDICAGAA